MEGRPFPAAAPRDGGRFPHTRSVGEGLARLPPKPQRKRSVDAFCERFKKASSSASASAKASASASASVPSSAAPPRDRARPCRAPISPARRRGPSPSPSPPRRRTWRRAALLVGERDREFVERSQGARHSPRRRRGRRRWRRARASPRRTATESARSAWKPRASGGGRTRTGERRGAPGAAGVEGGPGGGGGAGSQRPRPRPRPRPRRRPRRRRARVRVRGGVLRGRARATSAPRAPRG